MQIISVTLLNFRCKCIEGRFLDVKNPAKLLTTKDRQESQKPGAEPLDLNCLRRHVEGFSRAMKHLDTVDFTIDLRVRRTEPPIKVLQLFLLCEISLVALKDSVTYRQNIQKGRVKKPPWKESLNPKPQEASSHFKIVMESQTWSEVAVIASNVFRGMWGATELPLTCEERTQIGKSLLVLFRESPVLIPTYKAVDAAGLGTIYEASRNTGILNEATSVQRETPVPPPPLICDTKDQTSDHPEAGLAPKSPASKWKSPSRTPARPTTPPKEFIVIDDSLEERAQEGLHVDV